jgi:uncharacterized protein (TIGR02246 family)
MKRFLVLTALLIFIGAAQAQPQPAGTPRAGAGGPRTDLENDTKIRELYKEFVDAWNRHDFEALKALWTIDGDHQEPDGTVAKGREDVGKLFAKEHMTVFKNSQIRLTIHSVWFLSADVALVEGSYELAGVQDQHGKDIPPRQGRLTSVLLNEPDVGWRVAASRSMIPVPLVWREN